MKFIKTFFQKKDIFIPVEPIKFSEKENISIITTAKNKINSDVFEFPSEEELNIIKVNSTKLIAKPPLRVSQRSKVALYGNVRDVSKVQNTEDNNVPLVACVTEEQVPDDDDKHSLSKSKPMRSKRTTSPRMNDSLKTVPIKKNISKPSNPIPPSVTKRSSIRIISSTKLSKESTSKTITMKRSHINESKAERNQNDDEFEIFIPDEDNLENDEVFEDDYEDEEASKKDKSSNKSIKRKLIPRKQHKANYSKSSRWERIKKVLESGGTVEPLPGRVDEFDWIKRTVVGLLESSLGGCLCKILFYNFKNSFLLFLDISGVPGTGKTATTHRTLDSLSLDTLKGKCPDFDFVEINGMRLSDPGQAYSILARTIFKRKVPASGALALKQLEKHFKDQQKVKKLGKPCVVLLDELDLLLRKRQSLLYHFFEWPNWTNSQLIVITIANTMDLPERFLSNRISSRLGLTRYNFKPYDHAALSNIIEHQLKDYIKYLGKDAIQLCARKVSAVSGDARRAVNLAKRAIDYFRSSSQEELQARINGRQVLPVSSELSCVNLRLMDIILKDALMANPIEVIGKLSKHQRILLLSVLLTRKRLEEEFSIRGGTKIIGKSSGNNVVLTLNRVLDQHFQLCRTHQYYPLPSLQELYILLESLEALKLLRCLKFREFGPESIIQLLVHEEDVRKGLGDDQALKKYIRE